MDATTLYHVWFPLGPEIVTAKPSLSSRTGGKKFCKMRLDKKKKKTKDKSSTQNR